MRPKAEALGYLEASGFVEAKRDLRVEDGIEYGA